MPLCHIGLCGHAHPHDLENNKYMWCLSTEKFPAARLPPESRASSDEVPKWQSWKELGIKFGWRRNLHHQATKSRKVAGRCVHSRMQKWREPVSGVWSEDGRVYFGDSWERRPIQKHTSVTAGKRQAEGKFLKEIIFLAEDKRWLIVDLYSSIWNIFIGKAPLFETTTKIKLNDICIIYPARYFFLVGKTPSAFQGNSLTTIPSSSWKIHDPSRFVNHSKYMEV